MKHYASSAYWKRFDALSVEVQALARKNFDLLKANPAHPSLDFKSVDARRSVRVGLHYLALGVDIEDGVLGFWNGSHAEYDRLIR